MTTMKYGFAALTVLLFVLIGLSVVRNETIMSNPYGAGALFVLIVMLMGVALLMIFARRRD